MKVILNPDKTVVKAIRNRLIITEGQCPCVQEDEWTQDTICPCKKFREDKECCCGLYVKQD
jgi:ferredoxin-thioredoxin reductase catalytic subunit